MWLTLPDLFPHRPPQVAEGSGSTLLNAEDGDAADPEADWKVTFAAPVITLPSEEEAEEAGAKKKKGKAKVRPVWFDLSFDGGANWFSAADGEDVHIQVKDPA